MENESQPVSDRVLPSSHSNIFPIVVDIVQNVCLINMGTADIYGSVDPFQRMPKSPRPGFGDGSPSEFIQRVDLSNYR